MHIVGAFRVKLAVRWIPSELSWADPGSRAFSSEVKSVPPGAAHLRGVPVSKGNTVPGPSDERSARWHATRKHEEETTVTGAFFKLDASKSATGDGGENNGEQKVAYIAPLHTVVTLATTRPSTKTFADWVHPQRPTAPQVASQDRSIKRRTQLTRLEKQGARRTELGIRSSGRRSYQPCVDEDLHGSVGRALGLRGYGEP